MQQKVCAVGDYFTITREKASGVFVINPAITRMRISLEDFSPLDVLPLKTVISGMNYAFGERERNVEVRFKTNITNAKTGDLLVSAVFHGDALQLENDTEQLTKEHAKKLIDSWVKQ
ncbi:MAG: DUF3313 family protein [Psychrobium sp.]|nr:DUF3313 family protein [Psychrobium sp.]